MGKRKNPILHTAAPCAWWCFVIMCVCFFFLYTFVVQSLWAALHAHVHFYAPLDLLSGFLCPVRLESLIHPSIHPFHTVFCFNLHSLLLCTVSVFIECCCVRFFVVCGITMRFPGNFISLVIQKSEPEEQSVLKKWKTPEWEAKTKKTSRSVYAFTEEKEMSWRIGRMGNEAEALPILCV